MGRRFHQYEMGDLIGRGAMGSVYRGRNVNLDSPVAIKVLHPALTYDRDFLARFEQEARTAAAIQSPNIVNVVDFGSENDTYFIVMEFVDGTDMAQIFSDLVEAAGGPVPLPPEICLLILEQAADGLRSAHEKGIWHRDIKPSNIMLDRQGHVHVADFGLARDSNRSQDVELTRFGVILGTPSYMSPEQAAGEKLDSRTDIFSLGVVAYQWLTGNKPFPGDSPSEVQQKIIVSEPAPLVTDQMPWITPQIQALLSGSLHKMRSKRFQTMDEFLAALRTGMESLDPGGGIVINRREYLRRFAQDPVAATNQLRHESVQAHLRRGLRLKDMGLDKLEDALYEFRFVQALEPTNRKADEALRELDRLREDSCRKQQGDADKTRVYQHVQVQPPRKRRWLRTGLAVLTMITILFAIRSIVLQPRSPSAAGPAFVAVPPNTTQPANESSHTAPPPIDADGTGPVQAPANQMPPAAPLPSPDEIQALPETATLKWRVNEEVKILIDGKVVWSGKEPGSIEVAPDRAHRLSVRDDSTFARLDVRLPNLSPDQTHDLGLLELPRGSIEVTGIEGMTVAIDDRPLPVAQGKVASMPIGAGPHELTIGLPGTLSEYDIKHVHFRAGAGAPFQPLEYERPRAGEFRCRFSIDKDRVHAMAWTFKKSGG